MGISIVGLVAARRANKQHRQKGHQYFTHGFNYKYVRMELERQHACAQHVLHGMNGHYNLFLCNLSAHCTFTYKALIISAAKRADNTCFYLHRHLHYCERRCVMTVTGGRENSNGRAKKQPERRIFLPPVTAILPYLHANGTITCTCCEPCLRMTCSAGKVQMYLHTASV